MLANYLEFQFTSLRQLRLLYIYTHMHTHTHMHTCIYMHSSISSYKIAFNSNSTHNLLRLQHVCFQVRLIDTLNYEW